MEALYSPQSTAERLIALGRVVLAATSLLAIWLDPSEPSKHVAIAYALLAVYLGYALLLVPLVWVPMVRLGRLGLVTHLFDLAAFTAFMYFTEGSTSPFFVYFVFSLFCATLRWHQSGTLWTALAVLGLFIGLGLFAQFVLQDPSFELNRFIIRSIYLALVAVLLGYLSSYEQSIRDRLARLATWSYRITPPHAPKVLIQETLRHAAEVLDTPRVLMIWEQPEEPFRHVAYFAAGKFQWNQEPATAFEPLVAAPLSDTDFLCLNAGTLEAKVLYTDVAGFQAWFGSPLNPELQTRFAIKRVLCAILSGAGFQGWLLFLDKPEMTSDDLILGRLAARQVTAAMNCLCCQRNLPKAAVMDERLHFARDLHDSLLQTLTGVALQLETVRRLLGTDSEAACQRLKEIQALIVEEQRGLRSFIQELKLPSVSQVNRDSSLDSRLDRLAQKIKRQWELNVELLLKSAEGCISEKLAREVYQLIHEALINSARHAGATRVLVNVGVQEDQVCISVKDNGRGFAFRGRYTLADLTALGVGPKSLKDRITRLGGQLIIDSSSTGASLEIALPLRPQPPLAVPLSSSLDSSIKSPG